VDDLVGVQGNSSLPRQEGARQGGRHRLSPIF
jgi:hypothetical protein